MSTNIVSTSEPAIAEAPQQSPTAVPIEQASTPPLPETDESSPVETDAGKLTAQRLRQLGVFRPTAVDGICNAETSTQFLVDGFLPAKSIGIAAGDSTIGKSPLMYQLGLCVAAGVPFLGQQTKRSRVVYFDLENAMADSKALRDALVRFLGLSAAPEDFLLAIEPKNLEAMDMMAAEIKPALVIIDSLRAFAPDATAENPRTAEWLKKVRSLVRKYGVCFLLVHHLRKPKEFGSRSLHDEGRVSDWLLEMEGARALVNQTDVRVALEEGDCEPAALKMKWARRLYGDSPLILLERVCDDDGEPAGYRQLTGADLLNPERRAALDKLPDEFHYKDAKQALNRGDASTDKFLKECVQIGIVMKVRKGQYRKIGTTDGHGG